jgi:tryptophanyl-tRNA synthetase
MGEKRVFSGIQPSGNFHIGNYIGAVSQWVKSQSDGLNIFCIVDLHAITVEQDPQNLHKKTLELASILVAAGIDPEKSILFVQSHNPDHANLGWILNCFTSMGQMQRMTQFKEKSENKEFVSVGLFDYPALMAADILLYNTTEVPIGEDQKQHVELARDIAERFNTRLGETFVLPEPVIPKTGGRIMSLIDPKKKMSKSDPNPAATIYLLDTPEEAKKKIMSATTDSENTVKYDSEMKPGVSNLMEIYSQLETRTMVDIENEFQGKGYKEFKERVSESVGEFLKKFQEKYAEASNNEKLEEILAKGSQKAKAISQEKLKSVYKNIGFVEGK